jgi:hypothetical protein
MLYADSDARCIKAIELTVRFVLLHLAHLALLFLAICVLLKNGCELGADAEFLIVVSYFTVAYKQYGRGNRASSIIAGLAGLTAAGTAAGTAASTAAAVYSVSDDEEDSESDSATGFGMAGFDAMGNLNGVDMSAGVMSLSDDFHHNFNTANGLPMINDAVDIHGNIFGTTFMDDMMNSSTSAFDDTFSHSSDDSFSHSSFDSSFSFSSGFDDDWA